MTCGRRFMTVTTIPTFMASIGGANARSSARWRQMLTDRENSTRSCVACCLRCRTLTRAFMRRRKNSIGSIRGLSRPGVSLREVEGQPTVVSVERGSDAERVGIRAGDVIETIEGQPARSLLEQKLREQAGSSTPQAARLFALAALTDGPPETTVAIEWKGADDKERKASLHRRWHERSFALRIIYRRRTAVVVIDAFTETLAREFARALNGQLSKLNHTRGIILDLQKQWRRRCRSNGRDRLFLSPGSNRFGPVYGSTWQRGFEIRDRDRFFRLIALSRCRFRLSFSRANARRARPRSWYLL